MEQTTTTTKHRHPVVYGRRIVGCPRCAELTAGARPIEWSGTRRAREDRERSAEINDHFRGARHLSGGCGPVCTFGDY